MLLDAEARRRGETRGEHVRISFSPWNAAQESQNRRARSQRRSYGCAARLTDRKSTRLNSSHLGISYAVFCLKKKKRQRGDCPVTPHKEDVVRLSQSATS